MTRFIMTSKYFSIEAGSDPSLLPVCRSASMEMAIRGARLVASRCGSAVLVSPEGARIRFRADGSVEDSGVVSEYLDARASAGDSDWDSWAGASWDSWARSA